MSAVAIIVVLVLIAVAAPRYGADTRVSDSWTVGRRDQPVPGPRPTPLGDLRRLVAAVRRRV